jgi:hypothetical protein
MTISKLALGTVQFGMDYGVTNPEGKIAFDEVCNILLYAKTQGIDVLDTAQAYGDSETVIGKAQKEIHQSFKIISKVLSLSELEGGLSDHIKLSLDRLQCHTLDGLLLHRADDLLGELADDNFEQLLALKEAHLVNKVGVSVYAPEQARLIAQRFPIDLIQLPLNLFDQRFNLTGCMEFLAQKHIEIHARSLFLQGILLNSYHSLPSYFHAFKDEFDKYHNFQQRHQLSPLQSCFAFCQQIKTVDKFVIGCCSQSQLQELCAAFIEPQDITLAAIQELSVANEDLILPQNWK